MNIRSDLNYAMYGRNQKREHFVIALQTVLQYFVVKLLCILCKITNGTTVNYKSHYTKLRTYEGNAQVLHKQFS